MLRSCDLRAFNAERFAKCLAGRRMVMIGDSTMNGIFNSLACLTRHISTGRQGPWEDSDMTRIQDAYWSRNGEVYKQVLLPCLMTLAGVLGMPVVDCE
jgi:hypothetical protein